MCGVQILLQMSSKIPKIITFFGKMKHDLWHLCISYFCSRNQCLQAKAQIFPLLEHGTVMFPLLQLGIIRITHEQVYWNGKFSMLQCSSLTFSSHRLLDHHVSPPRSITLNLHYGSHDMLRHVVTEKYLPKKIHYKLLYLLRKLKTTQNI